MAILQGSARRSYRWLDSPLAAVLVRTAAGALTGVVTLAAFWAASPGIDLSFRTDVAEQRGLWRGFHPPEPADDGGAFAWTERAAEWRLRGLDRTRTWTATIRLRPAVPDPSGMAVAVLLDGVRVASVGTPEFSDVTFEVPAARRAETVIGLSAERTVVPGETDRRELGAMVRWLRLTPAKASVFGPSPDVALTAAAIGGTFAALSGLLAVGASEAVIVVLFTCIVWAALMIKGPAPVTGFDEDSLRLLIVPVLIAALAFVWRNRPSYDRFAAMALAIAAALTFLRLCFLQHPSFNLGDTGFHLHRLQLVLRGEYFFLSNAPGGAFPYAPGFYVVVRLFTGLTRNWSALMRITATVADAAAALILYPLVVRRWQRPRTAAAAVLLYFVIPAGFQVQAVAYLTNAFAQTMAVIGLALLPLMPAGRWRLSVAGGAFVALTIALVSHTGTFFFLSVLLVVFPALLWWKGDVDAKRMAPAIAIAGIGAILAAVILYYGHFAGEYRAMLHAPPPAVAGASTTTDIPVQRAEAHQTKWVQGLVPLRNRLAAVPGYAGKYLGFVLIGMAAVGSAGVFRNRQRDPLSILLVAWCGVCGLFFVLGQLTPVDVRYYLAAFPALGILAALAFDLGFSRGSFARAIATAALVWCVTIGVAYWFAWFGRIPPR